MQPGTTISFGINKVLSIHLYVICNYYLAPFLIKVTVNSDTFVIEVEVN